MADAPIRPQYATQWYMDDFFVNWTTAIPPNLGDFFLPPTCAVGKLFNSRRRRRWATNESHLKAWQRGYTGFPLVDAAMRQLWITGWMPNYMRHVSTLPTMIFH